MVCRSDSDCLSADTGMRCVTPALYANNNSGGGGFCECERHSAYNASSCRCQEAELCSHARERKRKGRGEDRVKKQQLRLPRIRKSSLFFLLLFHTGEQANVGTCFNGMVCPDESCSCSDLSSVLFDATSRFCVLPRVGTYQDETLAGTADNR